jgi:putative flippase GtrA
VEVAGIAKVPAQALAVAASMPLNFLGNKLWSFRSEVAMVTIEA